MSLPARAACIGAGVIGAGWAARLVLNGVDVTVHDPAPGAERAVREVLANAERAYAKLFGGARPQPGDLRFAGSIADAVAGAELVQESVPERLDLKRRVLAEIDAAASPQVPVASSTSGLLPTHMQEGLAHPQRILVGHPFNPVYLLPLVEVVAGHATAAAIVERARDVYAAIGMQPVRIAKEIDAFVGDRLQEALWREALWLVHDGIATVSDIDDVIRYSFGLRWAQMGVFQVYRTAGGEAGMRHFMAQFGPCLKWPWTKLTEVPELTDAFIDRIAEQSDEQAGDLSIRDLERLRDDNLVAILQALKAQRGGDGWGAGALLKGYETSLQARAPTLPRRPGEPLRLVDTVVDPTWLDYNGHMTEHRYVQVFSDATDALLRLVGVDADYVAGGHSYYTVETHVMHRAEVHGGEPLRTETRVLAADDKRLHLFHRLVHGAQGHELASSEQMLLHVDASAGRACPAPEHVQAALGELVAQHAALPVPPAVGRHVGMRP